MRPSIYDSIPPLAATALTAAAAVIAAVGAALVFMATVYGDWIPAVVAAATFTIAGVMWHGADHAVHRTDK
jgi:hypothetical protein